jgi:hypothetical protein
LDTARIQNEDYEGAEGHSASICRRYVNRSLFKVLFRPKLFFISIYFSENENTKKGKLKHNFSAKDAAKLWQEVTVKLNSCLGPKRSWKEWRKVRMKFK